MRLVKLQQGRDMIAEQARHEAKFKMARVFNRPIYLRHERQPDWKAELPIYVRWCDDCGIFSASHPAGYGRIHCAKCEDVQRVMTYQRWRDKIWPLLWRAGFRLTVLAAVVYGVYTGVGRLFHR